MLLLLLLLSLPLICLLTTLHSLHTNHNLAASLHLPLIHLPIDGHNLLFQILGPLLFSIVDRLGLKPYLPHWTLYLRRGWNFPDKITTSQRLGKAWALVTPGGVYLQLADADAIADVVARRGDFPRPTKPYRILEVFGPCISTADGDNWARHRKVLAAPFNEHIMGYVWTEALAQGTSMAHSWNIKGVKSYAKDTRSLSLNVLAATGFGKPYAFRAASDEEPEMDDGELSYRDALRIILDNVIMLLVLRPRYLTSRFLPRSLQHIGRAAAAFKAYMVQMLHEETASSRRGESGSGSLMTSLVRAGDSYAQAQGGSGSKRRTTGLSVDEIFGNIFVINFAGHDTTANTLAFSMLLLAAYPEVQEWLAEEVMQVVDGRTVEEWEYRAVFPRLYEVLRFFPSIMVIQKGPPAFSQTIHIQGRTIPVPPGVEINAHVLAVHFDSEYYHDPFAFQPWRWVQATKNGGPEIFIAPRKGAYLAWSEGPQICPGLKFSQVEFVAVLACLMESYRVRVVRLEEESEEQARSRVLRVVNDCDAQMLLQMKNPDGVKMACVKGSRLGRSYTGKGICML